jgi:hypothetical protein
VRLAGAVFLGVTVALSVTLASAQRSFEDTVLPLREYRSTDARVLAEAHAAELRDLYEDLRRCVPELDFNQPGIGFRKPRGKPELAPHLSIWMITDGSAGPIGDDLRTRAADAFQRYGARLLLRLVARPSIRADSRLGGYGLVLTWTWSPQGDERRGETLVVFVDGASAAGFVGGVLGPGALLQRADIRLFEGDLERPGVRITVDDAKVRRDQDGCR